MGIQAGYDDLHANITMFKLQCQIMNCLEAQRYQDGISEFRADPQHQGIIIVIIIMLLMFRCPIPTKPCHHHQCNGVDAQRTYKSSSCCCSSWLILLAVQLILTFFLSRLPILYQVPLVITWGKNSTSSTPTTTATTTTTSTTTKTNTITYPPVPITASQSQSIPLSNYEQQQQRTRQQLHSFLPRFPLSGICSRLLSSSSSSPIPSGITASLLWRRHVSDILEASIHPNDASDLFHAKWTKQLLKLLPPRLLQASVRSHPHAATWSAILQKLSDYYQGKNKTNAFTLPIINVVVWNHFYQTIHQPLCPTKATTTTTTISKVFHVVGT